MSRYISFRRPDGRVSWGRVDGDLVHDGASVAATLASGIRAGALDMVPDATAPLRLDELELLPVIPEPRKIICIGVNYRAHRDEAGREPTAAPTVFTRFADTQIGHGAPALKPAISEQFDYEGELALVIGRPAHRLRRDEAAHAIAGYSIYNDFSVRDWQRKSSQWTPGKNFPGTGGFGPMLVTPDEVGDVSSLRLETRVNGEVRQSASVADLIFDIPEILEFVTAFTALEPGDVVVTGTPAGVGMFMDPPRLLDDGDVVEVEISGLGVLRNPVREVA
jgi:2-keto-4-pentenoate hydratase/2-oxohepta-3-ene-1,7-dioic acid hydratase in catechol pathway